VGHLDEPRFESIVTQGCTGCGSTKVDIRSFLDQRLVIMAADPNDAGRWVHDGEKFVDGIYKITCAACDEVLFESADCPRCHAPHGLARSLAAPSRLAVPKRCPKCNELELLALALVPSTTRYGGGQAPKPHALADFGEPGHHVVAFACESCDAATVIQTCPLCDAPGPLRARP
jgi:hypothetical protein